MTFTRHWKVFCPCCGHRYNARADDREIRALIDRVCPQCYLVGQDATVVGSYPEARIP